MSLLQVDSSFALQWRSCRERLQSVRVGSANIHLTLSHFCESCETLYVIYHTFNRAGYLLAAAVSDGRVGKHLRLLWMRSSYSWPYWQILFCFHSLWNFISYVVNRDSWELLQSVRVGWGWQTSIWGFLISVHIFAFNLCETVSLRHHIGCSQWGLGQVGKHLRLYHLGFSSYHWPCWQISLCF